MLELEKSLDKLPGGPARDSIKLMGGDFNLAKVDWEEDRIPAGCQFPVQAKKMLKIAADQSFTKMNHKPTRGENCLDLIFNNHPQLVKSTHVTPGISDHDIVVLDSDLKAEGQKTKPRKNFQYKKGDMTGIQDHIQQATDSYIKLIFKKGDRHLPENYRLVSLTSVSCKILEHIVCRQIIKHLKEKKICTSLQHRFRSGHSCDTQLLITAQDIFSRYDGGDQIDIVILVLAFSKPQAFDVVPHQRLLSKLDHYGVRGETHTWIRAFLTGRRQSLAESISEW